jgi:hypothetical protein
MLTNPGVNSSSFFNSQSLTPSEGDIQDRLEAIVSIEQALKAVPNQSKSFSPEYATGAVKASIIISLALDGPIVSDWLLSREEMVSATHIKALRLAETLRLYPLKRRQ